MEFLDEPAKRRRTRKLFLGYFLIAVIIGLVSVILVYLAQGYGYDTRKGVTQNGLVFISAKPVGANISINNQSKGATDLRTVLPEGKYELLLRQNGYREWRKSFNLDGGTVLYYLYPKLFPIDIPIGVTRSFASPPVWASQSPDRRWLVFQAQANTPVLTMIDMQKPSEDPVSLTISQDQLKYENGRLGILKPIEWADDNKHLLIMQTQPSGSVSYIILNRANTDETINISDQLDLAAQQEVRLKDKKYDRYYILDKPTGELKSGDLKKALVETVVANGVVDFKSHGNDLIFYTTYENAKPTEAKLFVLKGQKDKYVLQSIARDPNNLYQLDLAKFQNNWLYVAASQSGNRTFVFRNPLNRAKANNKVAIPAQMSLLLPSPKFVSFSDNTRFIAIQSGKNFVVFDAEQNRMFRYVSPLNISETQEAKWMDGHRLTVVTDSKVQVFEFDGTNQQTLIASRPEYEPFFDRDYAYVYTMAPMADGKTGLESGKLIVDVKD
jgi:hypothetical protein